MRPPPEDRLPITVVIPVLNEERNLPACLARLGAFAEVWVVDSGSTDRTVEIAAAHGARVIPFAWNGRFPKKRNWILINHAPATPWVLFLDADELVVPEFVDELRRVLPATPHSGFWIEYSNHFLGRRLRHGAPMRKLALFRTGAGLYERIDLYLAEARPLLLATAPDPETFFVKTVKRSSKNAAYSQTTFYEAWRWITQRYGIYNPYTKRGAIAGLLPHGPHNVRDVLATHILKQTGSFEQASYAIQDTPEIVAKHYGRFLPENKAALAARILNEVWEQ